MTPTLYLTLTYILAGAITLAIILYQVRTAKTGRPLRVAPVAWAYIALLWPVFALTMLANLIHAAQPSRWVMSGYWRLSERVTSATLPKTPVTPTDKA